MTLSERKLKANQIIMMNEIEEFIEKNINDMHKALDELKISFEDEINNLDEKVYGVLVSGLREDMYHDLENLKEQYEEERRKGVEKIKNKYNLRK